MNKASISDRYGRSVLTTPSLSFPTRILKKLSVEYFGGVFILKNHSPNPSPEKTDFGGEVNTYSVTSPFNCFR